MDALAGIIGASVIASWAYGLVRDTGRILLDMNPDPHLSERLRREIETDGDKLTDLHVWRLGPGHLGAVMSVGTDHNREAEDYTGACGISPCSRTSRSRFTSFDKAKAFKIRMSMQAKIFASPATFA